MSSTQNVSPNVANDAKRLAKDADEFIQNSDNKQLIQFGLMAIGAIVVLRILVQSLLMILILVCPILYVYLKTTCPQESTFDAKKELKRVLRGHHLSEDNPNKPKGYFEKMAAKVTASVATELASALPGFKQEMTNYQDAFWIANIQVPSSNIQYWWIGALNEWTFVYSAEMSSSSTSSSGKKSD